METLETFSKSTVRLGLVTHANQEWTNFKLNGLNLRRFFEQVHIVHEDNHKTPEEWRAAIDHFGVEPYKAMVVGDNVKGDIQAAREIGVEKLVWIDHGRGWSLYRLGDVPEGTITVNGVNELIDALITE